MYKNIKVIFIAAVNSIHIIRWVNSLYEKGLEVVLVSLKDYRNKDNNINKIVKKEK